jgi:hypothetical protein
MDPFRLAEQPLQFQHRHSDGSWGSFEARPESHDPADHDPERAWPDGKIYKCSTCDEEILVTDPLDSTARTDV